MNCWENCFTDLWHQLTRLDSVTKQVNHILEFCKPYLRDRDITSQLLSSFENDLLNPIKVIAEQTHQTERNIQRKQKNSLAIL